MVEAVINDLIRDVPDFPKPGIGFKDITPILANPAAMRQVYDALAAPHKDAKIDVVLGIESRGFIFGTPLAHALDVGFAPIAPATIAAQAAAGPQARKRAVAAPIFASS